MWRPVFVIAEVLGDNAPNLVNQAATGVFGDRVTDQSLAMEILACIRKATRLPSLIIEAQKDKKSGPFIRTKDLVDHCNGYEERPWADWKTGDKVGLTIARFVKELRKHFKLKADRVWHEKKNVYGYWVEPFQKFFDSLPPEDDEPEPTDPTEPPDGGEKKNIPFGVESTPSDGTVGMKVPQNQRHTHGAIQNQTTPTVLSKIRPHRA